MEADQITVVRSLQTPRAVAVAGILFSVLLAIVLVLILLAARSEAGAAPGSFSDNGAEVGLGLVPFVGITFLWLIGVVRDRIGMSEDRFFATVFLGSGLLFVASLFAAAGITQGVLESVSDAPSAVTSETLELCRRISGLLLHTYAMRMAAVFMISTSTIGLRTRFMPQWLAFCGFAIALILLLGTGVTRWVELLFPLWTLFLSLDTLVVSFKRE